MAPFSIRKSAPAWPSYKDSYKRLGDEDDIQLMLKPDIDTAATPNTNFSPSPTPYETTFKHSDGAWWKGWRGGAKVAFTGAVFVLVANIVLLVAMSVAFPHMDGMSMIYIGSCTTSEQINTGIHFVVNVLSTGLLAASSYCMQILSAPTRNDVDKAHSTGTWLDIGVASLRNLRILRKQKVILWWLLAVSSIPLHLFYNSVFFTAIATHDYNVLYVTENFVNGASYDKQRFRDSRWLNVTGLQTRARTFERLDNAACIDAYALDFVTDRKDVILIVNGNTSTTTSVQKNTSNVIPPGAYISQFDSFSWICDDPSTPSRTGYSNRTFCAKMAGKLESMANTQWRSGGYNVQYCLSEVIDPDCHVHFAPQIMAPVLFFNIIKALVITYVAFFYKDKPLVTMGDAIESFSLKPDSTTKGMCLATHEMIEKHWAKGYTAQPMRYNGQGRRWFQAPSWKQWTLFTIVFGLAATAVFTCIILGIQNTEPKTIANAWSLGIGKVRTQNLITGLQLTSLGPNAVFVSALVANSPQAILSFIYLIYNNIFTTMVLNHGWDRFSIKRGEGRHLRVSDPRGDQKSTYFLQIPYRYAVVMLSTSGMLHWLVSQSVFLANISVIPRDGIKPILDEITTCAFSVKAMLFIILVGIFMLFWLAGNGVRHFSGGMPFVGSNSAAISAACHSEYGLRCEREAMVLKPLRWGVTDYGNRKSARHTPTNLEIPQVSLGESESSWSGNFDRRDARYSDDTMSEDRQFSLPVGHCAFSDGRVARPVHDRLYA